MNEDSSQLDIPLIVAVGLIFGCAVLFALLMGAFLGVIVGAIVGIILAVIFKIVYELITNKLEELAQKKANKRAFDKKHPNIEAEEFYHACSKAGVENTTAAKSIARIMECAKERCPKKTQQEAIDFYLLGKSEVERIADEEQRVIIAKLAEEEKEYEKYIMRFARLSPHNKVRNMCQEKADELRAQLEIMKQHRNDGFNSADKLYNISKRKEYDWATMGGIANGLAGGAAGVAVAVDAQIKNAKIRQQNADLQNAAYTLGAMAWMENVKQESAVEEDMEYWERNAQNARQLKVKEKPGAELLKMLSPTLVEKKQNKTGSMMIRVKIGPYDRDELKVGQNSAVIDGTIKAVFWKKGTRVGEAVLTLPLDYSGFEGMLLEGICRSKDLKYKESYSVTFEPDKLWVIEELWHLP